MRLIWDCGEPGCLGLDVQRSQEADHPVALTTVLTTLDRLMDKGILRREREGKAYRYWAVLSEDALQQRIVGGMLDRLIAQFPKAVAAYFVQQESMGSASLSELAQRLEAGNPMPEENGAVGTGRMGTDGEEGLDDT